MATTKTKKPNVIPLQPQSQDEKKKKPGLMDQIWQALVLPPKKLNYQISDLGPQIFIVANTQARREDFSLQNNRGQKMVYSYFEPFSVKDKPHPAVIYLHGNSSSRLEGLSLLPYLLPIGISVVLIDFAGCGLSEGQYISLGYFEKFDAKLIIDQVRQTKNICSFGIWGRSMGAATALMLGTTNPDIDFIVADSAFTCIQQLSQEVAKKQYRLPNFLGKIVWSYIRKKVQQKVNFDINECNTIKYVKEAKYTPAILFMSAKDDQLINYSHSKQLFDAYQGHKNILLFEGNHNSVRPKHIQTEIQQCFKRNLQYACPLLIKQLELENRQPQNSLHQNQKQQQFIQQQIQKQQQFDNFQQDQENQKQKLKNIVFAQPTQAKTPDNEMISEPDGFDEEEFSKEKQETLVKEVLEYKNEMEHEQQEQKSQQQEEKKKEENQGQEIDNQISKKDVEEMQQQDQSLDQIEIQEKSNSEQKLNEQNKLDDQEEKQFQNPATVCQEQQITNSKKLLQLDCEEQDQDKVNQEQEN